MKRPVNIPALAFALLTTVSAAGCASTVQGYANNSAGRALGAEMCESVRRFVHAPLNAEGLRRAWFLSFDAWGADVILMYAPMVSSPSDEHARSFYEQRVGQLTHYLYPPKFAQALASCLSAKHGFTRLSRTRSSEQFRASFRHRADGRFIEISANAEEVTSVVIASGTWQGDLDSARTPEPDER